MDVYTEISVLEDVVYTEINFTCQKVKEADSEMAFPATPHSVQHEDMAGEERGWPESIKDNFSQSPRIGDDDDWIVCSTPAHARQVLIT